MLSTLERDTKHLHIVKHIAPGRVETIVTISREYDLVVDEVSGAWELFQINPDWTAELVEESR